MKHHYCSSILLTFLFSGIVGDAESVSIKFGLAPDSFDPGYIFFDERVDDTTFNEFVLVSPSSPEAYDIACADKEGEDSLIVCSGSCDIDLSSSDMLDIVFEAPTGKEFEVNGGKDNRVEFEFKLYIDDDTCLGEDAGPQQLINGDQFTPTLVGSDTKGIAYDTESSFIDISCNELSMSIQYNGPNYENIDSIFPSGVRFSKMSFQVPYNNAIFQGQPTTFKFDTDSYMWIQASGDSVIKIVSSGNNYKYGKWRKNAMVLASLAAALLC